MKREALTQKVLVIGVDGWDPRLTNRFLHEGRMPNTQALLNRGAARKDLVLLGAHPTVTPPMWTTLATGAYAYTHGITCFYNNAPGEIDSMIYALDSRMCKAEQLWNVTAEAGKRTLVWHWPGSSWPPSSDSPLLHVVDGSSPGPVGQGGSEVEHEFIYVASEKNTDLAFRQKSASDSHAPCVITDLPEEGSALSLQTGAFTNILMDLSRGCYGIGDTPFDLVLSPIQPADGWLEAPSGAKECTLLLSGGFLRRPCLILPNDQGIYNRLAIYKSKKSAAPLITLDKDIYTEDIVDEAIKGDERYTVTRHMRILEMKEDGSEIRMWVSAAMNIELDAYWHPQAIFNEIKENVGLLNPCPMLGGSDLKLMYDCQLRCWESTMNFQSRALNYLIAQDRYDVIFSHVHNIDMQMHMVLKYMDKGSKNIPDPADYMAYVAAVYEQADRYLGTFLHLLDKGWTILVVSDHGLTAPRYLPPLLGDAQGVNIRIMQELGFTALKTDENGRELEEIDWAHTVAVANRANHIYLNLKGRDPHGIVEPENQFEIEEDIITALYSYRHPQTNRRVVTLAVRNKDAVLFGLGGPESGDIIYFITDMYNYDHADSLSTCYGCADTSSSPIFMAAGQGIKAGYTTNRVIREVDVAPTIAALVGVRMPRECEGAPIYQILTVD